jgi:3-hydroxyisobutyrate dehydrogenase-like beta-hydroxyacid dehydrogenase
MAEKVAFIGLGVMGFPMAGHLAKAGHAMTIWNRTQAKAERWVGQFPGRIAKSPADAAKGAGFVMTCVGNDDDLRQVTLGEGGALAGMAQGSVLVDHTTASADVARELEAAAAAKGVGFLDAPISGGQVGAEKGQLAVMAGGKSEIFAKSEPVVRAYARMIRLIGPAGSGQLAKMVNQICIGGLVQSLAEAISFGRAVGLDLGKVFEVISTGGAQSWQMENRHRTMIEGKFDFGFAVDWMRKDLGIVLAEAKRTKTDLPVTALVDQFYAEVQAMGGGRWDTSSLLVRLEKRKQ